MTEDRFDSLIDDVAKEMTSTPHDARFVEKVSLRIADNGVRRRAWLRPWVLVPAVSACALMLAVFVRDRPVAPVRLAPSVPTIPVTTTVARQLPPPAKLSVEPIEVKPLELPPLVEPQQIEIRAIAIDRIDIAPMP